jgi:hypothetical protein
MSFPSQYLPAPLKDRLRKTRDHLRRPRWDKNKPVRFITSFNEVFFEASGRQCLEQFRHFNPQWPIASYIEATQPGALSSLEHELKNKNFAYVLLDEQPLLQSFLETARDVIPVSLGGDAPEAMFPGEGPASESWFRKHMFRWFRKIVALDHAAAAGSGVLVWMDCDCYATAPLPQSVLESAFGDAGIFFMKGNRDMTEAGLVGYDLDAPGVRPFLAAMKAHYMERRFEKYARWDDCFTFDFVRTTGVLAPGVLPACRDIGREADDMGNILDSTPFAPFLTHDKGLHSRKLNLVN